MSTDVIVLFGHVMTNDVTIIWIGARLTLWHENVVYHATGVGMEKRLDLEIS